MFSLSLAFIVLLFWILANLLQAVRPLTLWAMPALGIGLLVALLPAGMPEMITDTEMPDQFVLEHMDELQQTHALISNELGSASALSWRLRRPEVAFYDTEGELRYGLKYADSIHRKVDLDSVQAWLADARQQGSVGVLMRVRSTSEHREEGQLPPGGKRYRKGDLLLIIYPQLP
jgi:4-amino-4-deoxy-L-arabinose transferase